MSTTRMRLGALVSAGVLGLSLSACGGDDVAEENNDSAATATDEADTGAEDPDAAEETEGADAGAGATEGTTQEDTGADAMGEGEEISVEDFMALVQSPDEEQLASYTMTMSVELDGQTVEAEGAVDMSGEQAAMRMDMEMPEVGAIEMISVDGEMYMAMPGVTQEGQYVQSDDLMGSVDALGEMDVSTQWEAWEQGAQEIRYLGDEEVDGMQLGHYRLTVDAAAAAEAMGQSADGGADLEEITYDVWLDDENFMRMISFDLGGTVEMRLDNWGEPQDIEAPAADQIVDMEELMNSGGNG